MFPVDAFQNTIAKATSILRRLQIRFHLTGGLTTVLYSAPRMTQQHRLGLRRYFGGHGDGDRLEACPTAALSAAALFGRGAVALHALVEVILRLGFATQTQ